MYRCPNCNALNNPEELSALQGLALFTNQERVDFLELWGEFLEDNKMSVVEVLDGPLSLQRFLRPFLSHIPTRRGEEIELGRILSEISKAKPLEGLTLKRFPGRRVKYQLQPDKETAK